MSRARSSSLLLLSVLLLSALVACSSGPTGPAAQHLPAADSATVPRF